MLGDLDVKCHVCRRPVESVETYRDIDRAVYRFVFKCHGQVQAVEVTQEEFFGAERIQLTECFVPTLAGPELSLAEVPA